LKFKIDNLFLFVFFMVAKCLISWKKFQFSCLQEIKSEGTKVEEKNTMPLFFMKIGITFFFFPPFNHLIFFLSFQLDSLILCYLIFEIDIFLSTFHVIISITKTKPTIFFILVCIKDDPILLS